MAPGAAAAHGYRPSVTRSRHRLFPSSAARARVGLKNAIMQIISIRAAIYWRNSGVKSRCGSLRSAKMNIWKSQPREHTHRL
jgi:hypothetical protein